jgi:hypothetical protein
LWTEETIAPSKCIKFLLDLFWQNQNIIFKLEQEQRNLYKSTCLSTTHKNWFLFQLLLKNPTINFINMQTVWQLSFARITSQHIISFWKIQKNWNPNSITILSLCWLAFLLSLTFSMLIVIRLIQHNDAPHNNKSVRLRINDGQHKFNIVMLSVKMLTLITSFWAHAEKVVGINETQHNSIECCHHAECRIMLCWVSLCRMSWRSPSHSLHLKHSLK